MVKKILQLDGIIIAGVFLLLSVGLVMLYSTSSVNSASAVSLFQKQIISVVIGVAGMLMLSFFDYQILNSNSTRIYFGSIVLLVAVFFLGTKIRGTVGWIGIGNFHIQPVEIVKIAMIVFLASFLSKKKNELSIFVRVAASVILVGVPVALILKQPDFGSSAVIVGTWLIMLMVSGVNKKNLLLLGVFFVAIIFAGSFFMKDYQKERLINFVNPYNDPRGSGYNVIQSIVAVGSGGLWGKGLGHGSQSQLNFLPEKHTDFIFAVIVEELGFFGALAVIFLFGVLLYRIKEIARLSRDNFGYLMAAGIMTMIFIQTLVNIGMNVGLVPVAGVPLPILSYGGSSLVSVFLGIGIVQSIYIRKVNPQAFLSLAID